MKEKFHKDIQVDIKQRFPELSIQAAEKKMEISGFAIDEIRIVDNDGKLIIRCNKITTLVPRHLAEYIFTYLNTENAPIQYNSDACLYLYPSQTFDRSHIGSFDRRMWVLRTIDSLQKILSSLNIMSKTTT